MPIDRLIDELATRGFGVADDFVERNLLTELHARCLELNVLTDPQDGDVGSIMGLGFAPQTGGAISLIDQVGVKQFVAECDELAKKYGKQFEVPKLLRDMAAKNQSFYGNYQPAKAA